MLAEFLRASPRTFVYLRTRPEIGGSFEAVIDHGLPQGLAQPPLGLVACHGEELASVWIHKVIVNYAVIRRIETCNYRIMIWESQSREDRNQTHVGLGPVSNKTADIGSGGLELVTESKPIRGNQEDNGMVEVFERTS